MSEVVLINFSVILTWLEMLLALLASAAAWPEAHAACDGFQVGEPACLDLISTLTAAPASSLPLDIAHSSETDVEAMERVHLPLPFNFVMSVAIKAIQAAEWIDHHARCVSDLHAARAGTTSNYSPT